MNATKAITLRLDPADHAWLEAEAKRLGLSPGTLARVYVRAGLRGEVAEAEQRRRTGREALDRLDALRAELRRAGYPSVDTLTVLRESRKELEQRPRLA
jgi:methylphosphotriester-DNA--protein-cysteine methyltransferase